MSNTLLFTPAEVSANYPAFFQQYPVPPEKTAIGVVFRHNFNVAKKSLRAFFPFDGMGRIKIAAYEDSAFILAAAFPNSLSLMRQVAYHAADLSDEQIFANATASGAKVSRFVLGLYKTNPDYKARIDHVITYHDLCLELPLLPLAKRHDFETFVQNFYSEVAKTRSITVDMIFSVNPYDIANASNGGRFSSCNNIKGDYNSAPICAAASPTMAIIKLENSDTKELLGRCYVSVSPDFKSFVVQPTYGYMKDDFVKDAEKWLCAYINNKLGDAAPWRKAVGLDTIHSEYVSDCKSANFYVDNSASIYFRKDYKELPAIRLGDCHCLVCGTVGLKIVCDKCMAENFGKCVFCRQSCLKSDRMCKTCAGLATNCPTCGNVFVREKGAKVDECPSCQRKESFCIACGKQIVWYNNGKSLAGQNLTEILGGVFKAHTSCVTEQHAVCDCGSIRHKWESRCAFCEMKRQGHNYADRAIGYVTRFKDRLRTLCDDNDQDISVGSHMLMPQPTTDYAMAA